MRYEWIKTLIITGLVLIGSGIQGCSAPMDVAKKADATQNLSLGQAYLEKIAKEPTVKKLPSGILYKIISSPNTNGIKPSQSGYVKVHYEGKLIDGTVFDSSFERGVPAAFSLQDVVKAWQIALPLMHKGDTWEIYVPSELAYGAQSQGPIPANSVLIFKIQLIDVMTI